MQNRNEWTDWAISGCPKSAFGWVTEIMHEISSASNYLNCSRNFWQRLFWVRRFGYTLDDRFVPNKRKERRTYKNRKRITFAHLHVPVLTMRNCAGTSNGIALLSSHKNRNNHYNYRISVNGYDLESSSKTLLILHSQRIPLRHSIRPC